MRREDIMNGVNNGKVGEKSPDYHLEELKFIRQRISELSNNIKDYEIYYIGAIGAVYGFMFLYSEKITKVAAILISLVPVLFSIYASIKTKYIFTAIKFHDDYIKDRIEAKFGGGFVDYYYNKYPTSTPSHIVIRYFFWSMSIILGIILSVIVAYTWKPEPDGIMQLRLELKI